MIKIPKLKFLDLTSAFFAIILVLSSVYPPFESKKILIYLIPISMIGWSVSTFLQNPRYYYKLNGYRLCAFILLLYTILIPYLFGNLTIGNRYVSLAPLIFFGIIFEYYNRYEKLLVMRSIIFVSLSSVAITMFKTGVALVQNPYIARTIKSTGEYSYELKASGIGGYGFIYCLVLFVIVGLYVFLQKKKKNYVRFFALLMTVTGTVVIILSNYFTALIVLGLGLSVLTITKLSGKKRSTSLLILFLLIIVIILFIEPITLTIISMLKNITPDGKTFLRLTELENSILYGGSTDLLSGRIPTLTTSLNTIITKPIFGLVITRMEYVDGYLAGIGHHSHILDTIALYGLPIGLLYFYILIKPITKGMSNDRVVLFVPILLAIVIILFMNTATNSIGFAAYFLTPFVMLSKNTNKRDVN